MQRYQRVTYEVRCQIYAYLKTKMSMKEISKLTGYHKSTIYREIKRNKLSEYHPLKAQELSRERFKGCCRKKVLSNESTKQKIEKYLSLGWSPEQISGRLRKEKALSISKQTIYNAIKSTLPEWKIKLRRNGKGSGRGRWYRRKVNPSWMKSIHDRPKSVLNRKQLGHWERDGMFGKNKRQVVVFLERKSRFIKLAKVEHPYCLTITSLMKKMVQEMPGKVLSLTNDRGNEFLDAEHFKIPVYYCDPQSPYQKGSVENAIGLLRQYLPKQVDLDQIDLEQIQNLEDLLNLRPRKCLDYKTPYEVLYGKSVALAS